MKLAGFFVIMLMLATAPSAEAAWTKPHTWFWELSSVPTNLDRPVQAYDIDGFDTPSSTVQGLHARGKNAVCYISAGTFENWRPDASKFPSSVKGRTVDGWAGERWLDIRTQAVRDIMTRRIQMCHSKGFDALEPDNIDGYQNGTGFGLTGSDQLSYNRFLASTAHSNGLAVLQKNDPDQASALQPSFDGALTEECAVYAECGAFNPYLNAGKQVWEAEYASFHQSWCDRANAAGRYAAFYDIDLDGRRFRPCWG